MASFTLRNVDRDPAWVRATAKARAEGWSMPRLILQLLADYADGRYAPHPIAPRRLPDDPE